MLNVRSADALCTHQAVSAIKSDLKEQTRANDAIVNSDALMVSMMLHEVYDARMKMKKYDKLCFCPIFLTFFVTLTCPVYSAMMI